jgi:hypothetical protein
MSPTIAATGIVAALVTAYMIMPGMPASKVQTMHRPWKVAAGHDCEADGQGWSIPANGEYAGGPAMTQAPMRLAKNAQAIRTIDICSHAHTTASGMV